MQKTKLFPNVLIILTLVTIAGCNTPQAPTEISIQDLPTLRWSAEKANTWYDSQPWYRGANFTPSTAINQLEFWQAETFDTGTIDRELGWAADIGMNIMRVYLHHLAWELDPEGLKQRMDEYLSIAKKHGISTLFVFFDDCWNPTYQAGLQPEPKIGTHNSGWLQDPGELIYSDTGLMAVLESYVKDILTTFKNDERIVLWDLYNEPGNSGYGNKSKELLTNVFIWARAINPSQPISVGVWNKDLVELNQIQLDNSDVITYHNYSNATDHQAAIDTLKLLGRPLFCTEYMARKFGSTFQDIMPMLKENKIGAINWGLVDGKTNTKYAWGDVIEGGGDPELWFHEIFRKDGTPYKVEEVEVIRSLTRK